MRSVAERYAVAGFAFLAAAVWLGVGLIHGFACLFVFVLAFRAVRLYQRRSDSPGRVQASRRERQPRHPRVAAEEPSASPRRSRAADRPASSRRLYDADRDESGWMVASEPTW